MAGNEVVVMQRDVFQLRGHVEQRTLVGRQLQRIGTLHDLLQVRLRDCGTRIIRLVHAVPQPGDTMTVRLRLLHELLDGFSGIADRLELPQHGFVRSTVQRTGQRVDARGDRGIQIRMRGTGDTHHGRGAVLLMVGVDDQQTAERVHVQRIGFERLVRHREAHAKEIIDIAA